MDFGEYLEEFGWSQAEFARMIGYSPDTVSRWRGEPPQIVMMYLELLADFRKIDEVHIAHHRRMLSNLQSFIDGEGVEP